MIKDNDRNLITNVKGIVQNFQAPFEHILNYKDTEESESVIYYMAQTNLEEPNRNEVEYIVVTLKNNKTHGDDNINSELITIGTQ